MLLFNLLPIRRGGRETLPVCGYSRKGHTTYPHTCSYGVYCSTSTVVAQARYHCMTLWVTNKAPISAVPVLVNRSMDKSVMFHSGANIFSMP